MIELLLTDGYRPWEPIIRRSQIPGWAGLLDLAGLDGYWQCDSIASLRMQELRARGIKHDVRHFLMLAAIEQELLASSPAGPPDFRTALFFIDIYVAGLLAQWSLTVLLRELTEQIPRIQDTAEQANSKGSAGALVKTQKQLLQAGLDSRIVVNDIIRYARGKRFALDALDFSWAEHPQRPVFNQQTVSLIDSLRLRQVEDGRRVRELEGDLRDVLSSNAELTAAIANVRLQRTAVWIAVISMIIAAVALVISLSNSSTPTPTTNAHIAHHSPSPSPTKKK